MGIDSYNDFYLECNYLCVMLLKTVVIMSKVST